MSWVTPPISSFVLICLTEVSRFRVSFSSSRYQCFILKDYLSKASISSMTSSVSSQPEDRLIYCLFSLPGQSVSGSAESDIGSFLPYIPVMSHWNLLVRCLCVLFRSVRATRATSRRSFNTLFSNITSRQTGQGSKARDTDTWKKHCENIHEHNRTVLIAAFPLSFPGCGHWQWQSFSKFNLLQITDCLLQNVVSNNPLD